jgi:hypothetical protein
MPATAESPAGPVGQRVYRWDLDKTYLLTDFDSVRGLLRSATEPARAKRAVPGASALLRELGREGPGWRPRIDILSGSPTQMRAVLEDKLRLDGVRWDRLTLKDNLGNLRRARIRAVRGQVGYKLPVLLEGRVGMGAAVRETLFGDDAEVDAVVYSVYADAVAGRIAPAEISRFLEAGGAYADEVVRALAALRRIGQAEAVDRIFIRQDRGRPAEELAPLGARVVVVRTWLAAALVLHGDGDLDAHGVGRVMATSGLTSEEVRDEADSMLRAGAVAAPALRALGDTLGCPELLPTGDAERRAVARAAPVGLDYVAFLQRFQAGR